jgi:hypothetical protein
MKKENVTTLTEMPKLPANLTETPKLSANLYNLYNPSTLPTNPSSLSNPFDLSKIADLNKESFHQLH